MPPAEPNFLKPTLVETFFNRALGLFIGIGLGPRDYYLLEVRGRKSGRIYSNPVYTIDHASHRYLVAPRGTTQWVRNARSAGRVTLRAGSKRDQFEVRELPAADRAAILKSYLARYTKFVQRYFQVQNGAPEAEFAAVADGYPVFELIPANG